MRSFSVGIICILLAVSSFGLEGGLESPSNRKLAINYEVVIDISDWWTASVVSPDGGAVFCYGQDDDCDGSYALCVIYDANGGQVGDTIWLQNSQRNMASVALLPDGQFVVAWASGPSDSYFFGYFQVFNMEDGSSPMDSPIQIDDDEEICGDTSNYGPHVTVLSNGYLLFSQDLNFYSSYYGQIMGRIFTSDGQAVVPSFEVNDDVDGSDDPWYAQGVALDNDGFAIVWNQDGDNIYIRYFDKRAIPTTKSILINSDRSQWPDNDYNQAEVYAKALMDGNILVNWEGDSNDYSDVAWIKIFDPNGKPVTKAINIVSGNYSKSGNYEASDYWSNNPTAQLLNGSIIIVFEMYTGCNDCRGSFENDIALVWRIISPDGTFLGPLNTLVNSTNFPDQDSEYYTASVAARGDGGWVITYMGYVDGDYYFFGICFDAMGNPVPWSFPPGPPQNTASLQARASGKYVNWISGVHL